jgi:hypothetical protein
VPRKKQHVLVHRVARVKEMRRNMVGAAKWRVLRIHRFEAAHPAPKTGINACG